MSKNKIPCVPCIPWRTTVVMFFVCSVAVFAQMPPFAAGAGGQMPDPKSMSGQPLPVGDLSPGTVVVRVVRGQMTNVVPGQAVTLTVNGQPKTVTTDQSGHAEFDGLAPGAKAQATVTVSGEKLDSEQFDIPSAGGIRLVLVATDPDAEKKAAEDAKLAKLPPVNGIVVIGDQSRFVLEIGDDALNVYNILPIVNTGKRSVQTSAPLVFELPKSAVGLGLLEGSTQQASASGNRVIVNGPFGPGTTLVQFAYSIPLGSDSITVAESMPASIAQFALVAQKTGAMHLSSPQLADAREVPADGQLFIAGQGRAMKAGETLTLTITGLPHHASWPRNTALFAAVVIILGGVWAARRRPQAPETGARQRLQKEQSRLYGELAALERDQREGRVSPEAYAARRAKLVDALEAVYARLDAEAAA